MSVTLALSVDDLTIRVAFVAALAIVALVLAGWRKPARTEWRSPRAARGRSGIPVDHLDTTVDRRPGPIRRILALAASGGIGVLVGVLSAIILSFAVAVAVIWMTNLLER